MSRSLENLYRRIILLVGRGVLKSVDETSARQFVQLTGLKGEVKDKVERVQNYGLSAHPPQNSQVIFVSMGGNRDHPVVVACEDPSSRPKNLKQGEVCIYTDEGDTIILGRNRKIEIDTVDLVIRASDKVRVETPEFEVTGDIIDRVDSDGVSLNDMRDVYNDHIHTGDDGGDTSIPHQFMED